MVILKGRSVVCISEWFGVCMARSSTAMVWGCILMHGIVYPSNLRVVAVVHD
jgi:hypothetical protein